MCETCDTQEFNNITLETINNGTTNLTKEYNLDKQIKYLNSFIATIKPLTHKNRWRAGIYINIGNQIHAFQFHLYVDQQNPKTLMARIAYNNQVDSREAVYEQYGDEPVTIKIINNKNILKCYINNQNIQNIKVDLTNVLTLSLSVWGDGLPCKAEFYNVKYKFKD